MFHKIENNEIVESINVLPKGYTDFKGVTHPLRQMWNTGAKDFVRSLGWLEEELVSVSYNSSTQVVDGKSYEILHDKVLATPVVRDKTQDEINQEVQSFRESLKTSQRKARLALLNMGLLPQVENAISYMEEPAKTAAQIEWEYAVEIKRTNPLVVALGSALELTEEDLDNLFIQANQIPD